MAQSFPFYNISNLNTPLDELEIAALKQSFPNLEASNIKKLGPATLDLMILQDHEGKTIFPQERENELHIKKLCNLHGCDTKYDYYIKSADEGAIKQVDAELCAIMKSHNLECITFTRAVLEYNCLGWSLGIRGWINPHKGYISKSNILETVNEFLNTQQLLFPINHEKNVLHILDKMKIGHNCQNETNSINQVAFFFKQNAKDASQLKMTHGTRYIDTLEELNNTKIDSWTSKLGHELLLSHQLSDLSDNSLSSTYGLPLCYIYFETHNNLVENKEEASVYKHDEL